MSQLPALKYIEINGASRELQEKIYGEILLDEIIRYSPIT